MSALQRSRLLFQRLANGNAATTRTVQRRGMASHEDTPVTWAEYRSGSKTLSEWVDGNRANVAFGFFCFYASLAAWSLRPKKGKKKAADPTDPAPTA